jgi:hypothetical protein
LTQSVARKDNRSGPIARVVHDFEDDLKGAALRWRASHALLTVLTIAAAMTAGCGASTTGSTAGQNGNSGTPGNSTATKGPAGMVRLGCSQYCLQAGGYGGGPATPNMTRILTTQVTALPDGTVAITVKCLFRQPCRGALLLDSGESSTDLVCHKPAVVGSQIAWWGQSDLDVPAQTTRTLGVTLSPCALSLLSQHGTLKVVVTADSLPTMRALSPADQKGLVPVETKLITVSAP